MTGFSFTGTKGLINYIAAVEENIELISRKNSSSQQISPEPSDQLGTNVAVPGEEDDIRETVPSQTSDMEKKTLSVLAH